MARMLYYVRRIATKNDSYYYGRQREYKKNFSVKSVNVISHFWRSTVVIEKVIYYDKE